jgi:hypothetical protein
MRPIKYGFELTAAMMISKGFVVAAAIAATGACIYFTLLRR